MRALLAGMIVVTAVACAHTPDLPLRPDQAPPIGSVAEVVTAPDGTQLLARHWAPTEAPRAVVVIMHGLKDHSARYASFATRLAAAGYSVYAFDLRGHGRSSGPRVAPRRWMDYVADLDRFLSNLETREPGRPIFVLGHSMGGAIAAAAAIAHEPKIAGLILSAPALALDLPPSGLPLARAFGALTPRLSALDLRNKDFSSDPTNADRMRADPLIHQPRGPAKTGAGLIDGIRVVWAHVDRLTMPILALHGTKDRLTAPSGSRALVRTAAATDKTLRIYEGFAHDLLHEPRGKDVEDDIVAWLDAHTGGTPLPPRPIYEGHLGGDSRGFTSALLATAGVAFEQVDGGDDVRLAVDGAFRLALRRPIGWHGAISVHDTGRYKAGTLAPAGIALRFGERADLHAIVGVATGVSLITNTELAIPATAWLELSFGPAHVTAAAELSYRVLDDPPRDGLLKSDAAWAGVALRYGFNRGYWPGRIAGIGPVLAGGISDIGDTRALTATLGIQVYDVD